MALSVRRILIYLLFLATAGPVIAEADPPTVNLGKGSFSGRVRLDDYITCFTDTEGNLGIEDARKLADSGRFSAPEKGWMNQGVLSSPVWIRFSVVNLESSDRQLLLSVDDPCIDEAEVWFRENGSWTHFSSSENRRQRYSGRAFRKSVVSIIFPSGSESEVFIRVYSPLEGSVLAFTLSETESFMSFEQKITLLCGVIFGAVLFFIIHFMRMSQRLKEQAELWYAHHLMVLFLYFAIRIGVLQEYIGGLPAWTYNLLLFLLLSGTYATGIKTFRVFVKGGPADEGWDRVFRILQWAVMAYVPLVFIGGPVSVVPGIILYTAIPCFTFHRSIRLWLSGSARARVFFIGWFGYTLLFSAHLLVQLGAVRWHPAAFGALPAAIIWSLVFFPDAIIWKIGIYKSQSAVDGLTGLANRREFNQRLKADWNTCRRAGSEIALVLMDIDHFKAYNDHYGHPAGDECLRKFSALLSRSLHRDSDMAFRYGGEEFAILLSGTNTSGATTVVKTFMAALAAEGPARDDEYGPKLTASFGISSCDPGLNGQSERLLKAADDALYQSKAGGRNTYTCISSFCGGKSETA